MDLSNEMGFLKNLVVDSKHFRSELLDNIRTYLYVDG